MATQPMTEPDPEDDDKAGADAGFYGDSPLGILDGEVLEMDKNHISVQGFIEVIDDAGKKKSLPVMIQGSRRFFYTIDPDDPIIPIHVVKEEDGAGPLPEEKAAGLS